MWTIDLPVEQGHVHRVRGAVDDVTRQVGDHDADGPREQAHPHDRQPLEDAQDGCRPGDADAAADHA